MELASHIFEACMRLEDLHRRRVDVQGRMSHVKSPIKMNELRCEYDGYIEAIGETEKEIMRLDTELRRNSIRTDAVRMRAPDYEDWFCDLRTDGPSPMWRPVK